MVINTADLKNAVKVLEKCNFVKMQIVEEGIAAYGSAGNDIYLRYDLNTLLPIIKQKGNINGKRH